MASSRYTRKQLSPRASNYSYTGAEGQYILSLYAMRLESRPTIYSVYTKSVSKQTPNINVTGMRVPLDRCRRYACALCADHQAVSRQHEQL